MYFKLTAILLSFLIFPSVYGQEDKSFQEIEQKSYALFLTESWDSLLTYYESKDETNFDYFYFHLRGGIAAYHLGNYYQSVRLLNRALKKNSTDLVAKDYLIGALIKTGEILQALEIYRKMPDEYKADNPIKKNGGISYIYLETGPKFPDERNVTPQYFSNAWLRQRTGYKTQIDHEFTFLFKVDDGLKDDFGFNQYQYYFAPKFHMGKRVTWLPAMHFLYLDGESTRGNDIDNIITDSVIIPPFQQIRHDTTVNQGYGYTSASFTQFGFVPFLGVKLNFNRLDLTPFVSLNYYRISEFIRNETQYDWYSRSYINDIKVSADSGEVHDIDFIDTVRHEFVWQFGSRFDYTFPFNKDGIKVFGSINGIYENGWKRLISIGISYKVIPALWATVAYVNSNNHFTSEINGSYLNNTDEIIKHKIRATLFWQSGKKTGMYITWLKEYRSPLLLNIPDYTLNGVLAGFKWYIN
jgi:tetratricopeptide (TPR) repeat protein